VFELKINLQLFAKGPEDEIEDEIEEEVEEIEEETEEVEVEEVEEEEVEEEVEEIEEEEPVDKQTPAEKALLAKYMKEKKARQELERTANLEKEEREREKARLELIDDYVKQGYPQPTAEFHANKVIEQDREIKETQAKLQDKLVNMEIKDLARSDPFYADAESFKDEIKGLMKTKELDAEQAYMMIRGKARTKEMQIEQQQTAQAKRTKAVSRKVVNATAPAAKNPYPLDADDKKALKGLQDMFPEEKWNAAKYWKYHKT